MAKLTPVVVLFSLLIAVSAAAQGTATIHGRVTTGADNSALPGVTVLRGPALAVDNGDWDDKLYRKRESRPDPGTRPITLTAIPYYAWDNRRPGPMLVWLAETPELAELPGEDGVVVRGTRIRASKARVTACRFW